MLLGHLKWSGCNVPIALWPHLPHSCHRLLSISPLHGAFTVRSLIPSSAIVPVSACCTGALGSTGLCVFLGRGSFPARAAWIAGPTRPHQLVLQRVLRLKSPVATGMAKIKEHSTHNIQGVKERDPSVLHDTAEAAEGESSTDVSERDPCDDASNCSICRGEGGASSLPPAPTTPATAGIPVGTGETRDAVCERWYTLPPLGMGFCIHCR